MTLWYYYSKFKYFWCSGDLRNL